MDWLACMASRMRVPTHTAHLRCGCPGRRGGAVRGLFLDLYAHFFRNRITVLCVAVFVYRLGGTSDKKSGLKGVLEASVLR